MDDNAATAGTQSFAQRVDALARRRLGAVGACRGLVQLSGGANKGTWSFDAPLADGAAGFILQTAAASAAVSTASDLSAAPSAGAVDVDDDWIPHLDGTQEFRVMQVAHQAGVPVPQVRHILVPEDGLGDGAVTGRIDGETLGARILKLPQFAQARASMAAQCGVILAAVHRMPTIELPFLRRFDAGPTLALYRRTLDAFDYPLPALELALQWARQHQPAAPRLTMVHGDFRTGNFIAGPDGIRAVLDWEIAHVGDPVEDLGYLCMRTWRFGGAAPVGGFGQRAELYAAYEVASGFAVDPQQVRFWEVLGSMRWAFGCVRRAFSYRGQGARQLELAAIGRRLEEPVYDILNTIEGRDV